MKVKFPVSSFQFQRSSNASSGIALIGLIVVIVLMGLLGGSVLMLITFSSMESLQTMNWSKAFFAAESGLSKAKVDIVTNSGWYTNFSTITGAVGEASFTVTVDHGMITSVGSKDETKWTSIWPIWHAMLVYGTRTSAGNPQYRIWDGSAWSAPSNALSVGSANINWVVVKACPRSNEYVAVTLDANRVVKAQVYRDGTWGNLQTIATVPNARFRGVDIAYESLSGDAMVVAADGTADPTCYVWDGNVWTELAGPARLNITRPGA
ncbi:MAG: hypothetical protein Q7J98_14230, partial [Kiritimatiellia bacterium]|nr:hypothetical protein [Kiritimatiellia bacterium]